MNYTLPALTSSRGSAALSSTMPILRSQTKMSGSSLNKTIMPKIEAVPNGESAPLLLVLELGGVFQSCCVDKMTLHRVFKLCYVKEIVWSV